MKALFIVLITIIIIGVLLTVILVMAAKTSQQQCVYISGDSCMCDNKKNEKECSDAGGIYSSTGKCGGDMISICAQLVNSGKGNCTYSGGAAGTGCAYTTQALCTSSGGSWAAGPNTCT